MSDNDVNKIQQNVKELQDQNSIDFQQWKRLGKNIEKLSEKIKLSDTNLKLLMKKIKNDYENLKKIIIDENIQVQLNNKIEKNKNEIVDSKNKIELNKNEIELNKNEINKNANDINRFQNLIIDFERFQEKYSVDGDDTLAFIKAFEYAYNTSDDIFATIKLKSGVYNVHEVNNVINGKVIKFMIEADNTRSCFIRYNGNGGSNSCLFSCGAMSFGGFRNLTLSGWDKETNIIANNIIRIDGVDHLSIWENLQFRECLEDAIYQTENAGFANWFIDRCRFDSVGGYCVRISCADTMENRPFKLSNFTVDNIPRGAFKEVLTNKGVISSTKTEFGNGVILANNATGADVTIEKGRIEYNTKLNGESYLFYETNTNPNRVNKITVESVDISHNNTDELRHLIVSENNKLKIKILNCNFNGISSIYYDKKNNKCYGDSVQQNVSFSYSPSDQECSGLNYQGRRIEVKNRNNIGSDFSKYKKGDVLINSDTFNINFRSWAEVCVYPLNGYGIPSGLTLGNAIATATNKLKLNTFNSRLAIDDSITLTLNENEVITEITSIDATTKIITVKANNLTVNSVYSLKYTKPIFRAIDGEKMDTPPTTGYWTTTEKVWNKTPKLNTPIGWICVSSGTPGVWKPFGLIVDNT